jgi:hypothetical protein
MTPAELEFRRSPEAVLQQAKQDMDDIVALRGSKPFARFFLRRMTEKRAALEEVFRTDDKITPAQREEKRQQLKLYDELLKLLETEESALRKTLAS